MYTTIKRLYTKTHDKSLVASAVQKIWITPAQYETIVGEPYIEDIVEYE